MCTVVGGADGQQYAARITHVLEDLRDRDRATFARVPRVDAMHAARRRGGRGEVGRVGLAVPRERGLVYGEAHDVRRLQLGPLCVDVAAHGGLDALRVHVRHQTQ